MNKNEFTEYLNLIESSLLEYAKQNNKTIEQILKELSKNEPKNYKLIRLEDTGLFNYKQNQSIVYNRLHNNNIATLNDLFIANNNNTINYGQNNEKQNNDYYIHNEIDGIISLLKYKYLKIIPTKLKELLNYNININYCIYNQQTEIPIEEKSINEFYLILKSCGFNKNSVNNLIAIIYQKNINNITIGEFLLSLSDDIINITFKNNEQELIPFINTLNIIIDFYNNQIKITKNNKKKE